MLLQLLQNVVKSIESEEWLFVKFLIEQLDD
ncbi:hypothetical protein GGR42_002361 [Saonia flava]|uniref:Uncharacterized protein n=1 Tax=Saonia flava TaxID=523696 RepID=A0A846R529_9FLAO|nr:hypothetical protein [Saonia flava]